MVSCYTDTKQDSVAIRLIKQDDYANWLAEQSSEQQTYLEQSGFKASAGAHQLIFSPAGLLTEVIVIVGEQQYKTEYIAKLSLLLPDRHFHLLDCDDELVYLGWGLGAYQFTLYKKAERNSAILYVPSTLLAPLVARLNAVYLTRDLINTPAEDMAPRHIADAAKQLAKQYKADCIVLDDQQQLKKEFPALYTVGKGSHQPACLIDLSWGDKKHPAVTLVGKGVSFDTGGLDIKPGSAMRLMKKDMGGAANVLGLASYIMAANLPVRLRVIIPSAENSISAQAMHPGDVIRMRNGKTVEIDDTDAEGRLILADALTYATEEKMPQVLFSFATLTGAARVAVGTEIAAYFSNNDAVVTAFNQAAKMSEDPVWQQPLYQPYARSLKTAFADLKNTGYSLGGAITAALFLQQFISQAPTWFHLDIMAYNDVGRPGHPEGGEAMGIAAAFNFIQQFAKT